MLKTITPELIADIIAMIPGEWLTGQDSDISQDEARHVYRTFLTDRLKASPHIHQTGNRCKKCDYMNTPSYG